MKTNDFLKCYMLRYPLLYVKISSVVLFKSIALEKSNFEYFCLSSIALILVLPLFF